MSLIPATNLIDWDKGEIATWCPRCAQAAVLQRRSRVHRRVMICMRCFLDEQGLAVSPRWTWAFPVPGSLWRVASTDARFWPWIAEAQYPIGPQRLQLRDTAFGGLVNISVDTFAVVYPRRHHSGLSC